MMRVVFRSLAGMILLCVIGCAYSPPWENSGGAEAGRGHGDLKSEIRSAVTGHPEVARAYAGLYEVMAICVQNKSYPWKTTGDLEEDVVQAREILELKHEEIPGFTSAVEKYLRPLQENRDLTEELRVEWHRRLSALSEACREGSR